jgi:hypothetical protein
VEHDQCSQSFPLPPQLSQQPPLQHHHQSHNNAHGVSPSWNQSGSSPTHSRPEGQTNIEALPSPLNGAQIHHVCHALRNAPHIATNDPPSVLCKRTDSGPVFLQPQSVPLVAAKEVPETSNKAHKSGLPVWQIFLITMGFIIFVFPFAILVAHCLAWFIVYKAEARLGEVRSGLLRGGEMKLCLCGRG